MLRSRTTARRQIEAHVPVYQTAAERIARTQITLLPSPFASDFAATIGAFYTGIYTPGRIQAIRMAYAQYPIGQKLYRVELEQVAQILGLLPSETVQNWALLLQQVIGGQVVPLAICRADETADPVSRKCFAPQPAPLPEPDPSPIFTEASLTPQKQSATDGGGKTILIIGIAAVAVILLAGRR